MGRIGEILKKDWTRAAVLVIGILFFVFAAIVIGYFVVVLCNDVAALSTYSPYPLPLTEARWMMSDNVSEAIKNALTVVCTYDAGELMAEFLASKGKGGNQGGKQPQKEPVVKEPGVKEPGVKEPAVSKEPAVKEPGVKEPGVKEPGVSKEPVVKKPKPTATSKSTKRKTARLKREPAKVINYYMELRDKTGIGEREKNGSQIGQQQAGNASQQANGNASQLSHEQYEMAYRNRSEACLRHIPAYMDKMNEGIQKYSELSFSYWEQTMCLVYIAVDIFMIVLNSLFLASCYLLVVAARRLEPACCLPFIILAGAAVFADLMYWIFRDSIVLPEDYFSVARIIIVVLLSIIFIGLVIFCICIVARFISSTYEKTLPADSPQAGPKQVTDGNREREVKDD